MQIDSVSGLNQDKKLCRDIFEIAGDNDEGILVEADLFNLGNLNNAVGEPLANEIYNMCMSIYTRKLAALEPALLYGFRKGGDEISFILDGVPLNDVEQALADADKEIRDFCLETSLHLLVHPKRTYQGGFGLNTIAVQIPEGAKYDDVSLVLQDSLTVQKETDTSRNLAFSLQPDYFQTESKHKQIAQVTARYREEYPAPLVQMPIDTDLFYATTYQTGREQRADFIQTLDKNDAYSLVRIDLMNMGGLNDNIGKDFTDSILYDIQRSVSDVCQLLKMPYRVFSIGGGVFDVVLETQDPEVLAKAKKTILNDMRLYVFDRTVEEYCKSRSVSIENTQTEQSLAKSLIRDIPNTQGNRHEAGIILTEAPLSTTEPARTLENLDQQIQLLKMHAVSMIIPHEITITDCVSKLKDVFTLRTSRNGVDVSPLYDVYPVTGKNKPDTIKNTDWPDEGSFPYARSLKPRLKQQTIQSLFNEGPKSVYAKIFGVKPTEEHLQGSLYATIKSVSQALRNIDLVYAYNAAREQQAPFITKEDSIAYLRDDKNGLQELISGQHNADTLAKLIQTCLHTANLTEQPVHPAVIDVINTESRDELDHVTDTFLQNGEVQLAAAAKNMAQQIPPLENDPSFDDMRDTLIQEVQRQTALIADNESLDAATKDTIIKNLTPYAGIIPAQNGITPPPKPC